MSLTPQAQQYLKNRAVKVLDKSTLKGIKLATTSYVIFSDLKVTVPIFGGSSRESKTLNITWDMNKTTVTGARIVIIAKVDWTPADYIVRLNSQQAYRKDYPIYSNINDSQSIDVSSLLQNGVNTFEVVAERPLGGTTLTISLTLEIDFENIGSGPITPPNVGGTVGGIPYTTIAIVAGGAGAFLLLLALVVRRH